MPIVVKNVKNVWDFIWNRQKMEAKCWQLVRIICQFDSFGQLTNKVQKHFALQNTYHIPQMAVIPSIHRHSSSAKLYGRCFTGFLLPRKETHVDSPANTCCSAEGNYLLGGGVRNADLSTINTNNCYD